MTGPSVFGAGWEEGKAAALYRPFIHAYATSTLMGENTPSNAGSAWQWPRYATAEYRRSGAFGATKGNRWTSGAKPEAGPWQSFVQLVYNGRQRPISGGPDSADAEYLAARAALERVWREHGQSDGECQAYSGRGHLGTLLCFRLGLAELCAPPRSRSRARRSVACASNSFFDNRRARNKTLTAAARRDPARACRSAKPAATGRVCRRRLLCSG